nr:MAG TPA: hypothetical protein [Caudoviricetes sp.]
MSLSVYILFCLDGQAIDHVVIIVTASSILQDF